METASPSPAHTPGPWYLSTKRPLASADSDNIERKEFYVFATKGNIATIPTDLISHVNQDAEANARLIAAAPDLLAACKGALEDGDDFRAMKRIQAAIAKAEG